MLQACGEAAVGLACDGGPVLTVGHAPERQCPKSILSCPSSAQVFQGTRCSAALAAGIFHRQEVSIAEVKHHMAASSLPTRV